MTSARKRCLTGATVAGLVAAGLGPVLPACRARPEAAAPVNQRPNILWVVWDTVRADHLSLYGYGHATTPRLDAWAKQARVFDDCTSVATTTTPSHASMFTGLMPSEHGASDVQRFLPEQWTTIAELLGRAGYQNYMYSANPNISRKQGFGRGFTVVEHPYDDAHRAEAFRLVEPKVPPDDRGSELPELLRAGQALDWVLKASGALAERATLHWLGQRDPNRPFFVFLNYMEAHRPCIPAKAYRARLMSPQAVERSYRVDRSLTFMSAYTFGLCEYGPGELELLAGVYDASLAELDDLFANLLAALEQRGDLRNTIVILTADHGEHLGEHHIVEHQFSAYEPLLRVPLLVYYPARFAPGRDRRPVSNLDLFPTLLELTGVAPPEALHTLGVSLLAAPDDRLRVAEYPAPAPMPLERVRRAYPTFDPRPWQRSLRAIYGDCHKYIWASDGRHELFDLCRDPQELANLAVVEAQCAQRLAAALADIVGGLRPPGRPVSSPPTLTEEELRRLAALGYANMPGQNTEAPSSGPATTAPFGTQP